ncbi:glycosyltransferase [Mesorhizobium sp. M0204]|uniref:glycosyltransferase n=1 Tax=unclassified Mesorhizobium TaxID=325217 RepID=UPI00333C605B
MAHRLAISIVIPNYNYSNFLEDLLSSINGSTHRSSIQIIIVDGGSTDNSKSVADAYLKPQDKLVCEPDDGQADAIAKGLTMADGRWFMFQNSDDMFNINALDDFVESHSTGVEEVVAYDQETLLDNGSNLRHFSSFRHLYPVRWRQMFVNIYYTNQSTIYSTKLAQKIGFDKSFRFALDYDFAVRFFKAVNPRVKLVRAVLGIQRLHENTKTSTMQDVCQIETKFVKDREFTLSDRVIGVAQAAFYHALKVFFYRFAAKRDAIPPEWGATRPEQPASNIRESGKRCGR